LNSEKVQQAIDMETFLVSIILLPVHVPQTPYFSLIPDVAPCLIEIAATKTEFAEVLIHLLENFYEVSPEIPMQRLNLVEALVSDLAINRKDDELARGRIYLFYQGSVERRIVYESD
jgi:hypothetical protein